MFILFKKSLLIYFGLSIISLVISSLFFQWNVVRIIISIFVLIICVIISVLISEIIANKEHSKLLNILFEECDSDRFCQLYYPVSYQGKSMNLKSMVLNNFALGCSANGDFNTAISMLNQALSISLKKPSIDCVTYYINLSIVYLKAGIDVEIIKENLNSAIDFAKKYKNNARYDSCIISIQRVQNELLIAKGEYDAPLYYFQNTLELSKNKYQRVFTHYNIAKIYGLMGDTEKQKEYLEYVIHNGNTLYIVKEAIKTINNVL